MPKSKHREHNKHQGKQYHEVDAMYAKRHPVVGTHKEYMAAHHNSEDTYNHPHESDMQLGE